MELSIEKFDPTIEQLNELVVVSKKVTDLSPIEEVKQARIQLKTARVAITKKGKELRDDAIKFQKAVIAKEKELVAIIEPEEDRLSEIEEVVKQAKLREERVALLPIRHDQLNKIGDSVIITDDELLGMDSDSFTAYYNARVATKNESDRLALEAQQAKLREEAEKMEREKEAREREAKARKEAEEEAERRLENERKASELRIQQEKENAERMVKEERERMEREQKAKEEREVKEKEEAERIAKAEQEKLEKAKKYQTWLKTNGYITEEKENYYFSDNGAEIKMYKLVSTFKK